MKDASLLGPDLGNQKLKPIMEKIGSLRSLVFPPVYFPDLTLKDRTESPSSFAAATDNTIVPELSAPSLGCSMGVIKTNLKIEDLTGEFLKKFYSNIQDELGKHYNFFENVTVWLGLKKRALKKYDLTEKEFADIIRYGARAAVKRYGYDERILEKIEDGGMAYSEEDLETLQLKNILPRSSFTNGRHDLGYGYKGNHFLEFQCVERIADEDGARKLGLEKENIIIMYHGGGGMIPYHVGRYYANRKKNTLKQKIFLFVGKTLFHFGTVKGIAHARERIRYYFLPHPFQEISLSSPEGRRLMRANQAALNYSYAFNIALLRRVEDALRATKKDATAELITARIHNAITEETVNEKKVVMHRHTANKVIAGKPGLISGYNNTNSYLVLGTAGAEKYLNSADHGAGSVIKRFEKEGRTKKRPEGFTTRIFTTKPPFMKTVEHITDEGIEYVVNTLAQAGIVKPLASLRPVAVFKG